MGRPSDYNLETASEICARIASGKSLRSICDADDMPAASTVFLWLGAHKEFSEQYTRACSERADAIFEESLEIADDGSCDYRVKNGDHGPELVVDSEHIQRSRLRVETRKWFVGKLNPKKYGEKVQQEVSGPEGGPLQIQAIERVIVDPQVKT